MTESHQQRIARILQKLREVKQKGLTCFGAESHKFALHPPLDEESLIRFESTHGIQLPAGYRNFLQCAGNGGAGPYYGIYPLERWNDFLDWTTNDPPANALSLPCPLHPKMSRDSDWENQLPKCQTPYQGMISIGTQGCTYGMGLIVTGDYAGRVVYVDAGGQAPYVVRERDFLSWYELWLDELIGGYDLHSFGYGIGGHESDLLQLLDDPATPDDLMSDALYALRRLPRLSPRSSERVCSLLRDAAAEVRTAACYVAEKFDILECTKFLAGLLNDPSPEVRKAAIGLAMKRNADEYWEDVLALMHSDDVEVSQRAFFGVQEHKKIPREILLKLVESSPHGNLRYLVAHAIPWQREDEELLIRLLRDDHPQVRFYAIFGLRQIKSKASLESVIELLSREKDTYAIDSILKMLGEVPGEKNAVVLLTWATTGDDFQRLYAIDSLCKLGDIRVEPVAKSLLSEKRQPTRYDQDGFPSTSHLKSIGELVCDSLRSSPNGQLRRLRPKTPWLKWLKLLSSR